MIDFKQKFDGSLIFRRLYLSTTLFLIIMVLVAFKNGIFLTFITGTTIPLFCIVLFFIIWGIISIPLKDKNGGLIFGLIIALVATLLTGYFLLEIKNTTNTQKILNQINSKEEIKKSEQNLKDSGLIQ